MVEVVVGAVFDTLEAVKVALKRSLGHVWSLMEWLSFPTIQQTWDTRNQSVFSKFLT
jgi:hypothetical protein